MAQYPALPLFTDSYMADTRHLTAAQHGAYLLLLMTAWRMPDCKLPDDDKFLAKCAAMDVRSWRANKDIIMSFWKRDSEGKIYQARLLDERKYVEDKRSKNASNAKARWLKNNDSNYATALPNPCQTDAPTPTPHLIEGINKELIPKKPKKKKNEGTVFLIESLPELWERFCFEEMGWSSEQAQSAFIIFREYSLGADCKNPLRKDWFLTFKNSCRSGYTKPNVNLIKGNKNGNQHHNLSKIERRNLAAAGTSADNQGHAGASEPVDITPKHVF